MLRSAIDLDYIGFLSYVCPLLRVLKGIPAGCMCSCIQLQYLIRVAGPYFQADGSRATKDGSLFRVDFGFIFGATPELDTPQTVVPKAVWPPTLEIR